MIHSLFVINTSGDVFMEKHWKSVISRSVCDYFFEEQKKSLVLVGGSGGGGGGNGNHQSHHLAPPPPVIATPHHYLINILRNQLHLVAVTNQEVPPLFVIEFLHRVVDILEDYFGDCTESTIKEHYVIVYELLDEMLDNGFPLATESNILKELIKPPNILRTIANSVTGKTNVSAVLPSGQLSNIPWRRSGVKYANNEAYFDVIEEVDAIIDKNGATVFAEILGYIDCCIKLSGMPDLTMTFVNPRILDDASLHPCVRFKRWETEKCLSFIPPDGNFRLISYHIMGGSSGAAASVGIPVWVRASISLREGRLEISVGPKTTMGRVVEGVAVEVPFPKGVANVSLTPSQGKYSFDPVSKVLSWDVGKVDASKPVPVIKGQITLVSGGVPLTGDGGGGVPSLSVSFTINQMAVSGLKVSRLDMFGEKYRPFKGVKYITKNGRFQVRL